MSSTLFTTDDGDVILRAGQGSGSTHDFRVHKYILSLASPIFRNKFALQSPNHTGQSVIPVVEVPGSPKALDVLLRFIYPVVECPEADLPTLADLFSIADQYNFASIWPFLMKSLKGFLPGDPFAVYTIACRHLLFEEAVEAARVSTPLSYLNRDYKEESQDISETDISRFIHFVHSREDAGRAIIQDVDRWSPLSRISPSDQHRGYAM